MDCYSFDEAEWTWEVHDTNLFWKRSQINNNINNSSTLSNESPGGEQHRMPSRLLMQSGFINETTPSRNMARLAGFQSSVLCSNDDWYNNVNGFDGIFDENRCNGNNDIRISMVVHGNGTKKARGRPRKNPNAGIRKSDRLASQEGNEPALEELVNLCPTLITGSAPKKKREEEEYSTDNDDPKVLRKLRKPVTSRARSKVKSIIRDTLVEALSQINLDISAGVQTNQSSEQVSQKTSMMEESVQSVKDTLENMPQEMVKYIGERHKAKIRTKIELVQLIENIMMLELGEPPDRDDLKNIEIEKLFEITSPPWLMELREFGIMENEINKVIKSGITNKDRLNQTNLIELKSELGVVLTNTLLNFINKGNKDVPPDMEELNPNVPDFQPKTFIDEPPQTAIKRPVPLWHEFGQTHLKMPNINLSPFCPSKDKPIEWLRVAQQKLEYYPCEEIYKTLALKQALAGELLQYWETIKLENPEIDWKELIEKLQTTSAPMSTVVEAQYYYTATRYRIGDDFERFLRKHEEYRLICQPHAPDIYKREILLLVMPDELRFSAQKVNIPTYEDLKVFLRRELKQREFDRQQRRDSSHAYLQSPRRYQSRPSYNPHRPSNEGHRDRNRSNRDNRDNRDNRERQESKSNNRPNRYPIKCYKCGGPHYVTDCPQIRKDQPKPGPSNEQSNVASKSVSTNENVANQASMITAINNVMTDDEDDEFGITWLFKVEEKLPTQDMNDPPVNTRVYPGIKCKVYDKGKCIYTNIVMCDTGSPVSIISEKILEQLCCEVYKSDIRLFGIVNGTPLPISGFLYMMVRLDNESCLKSIKFLVTKQDDTGILLGSNFTYTFNAVPIWKQPVPDNRCYRVEFIGKPTRPEGHVLHLNAHTPEEIAIIKNNYLRDGNSKLIPVKEYNNFSQVNRIITIAQEEQSLKDMIWNIINPDLSLDQKQELWDLMWNYSDIFSKNNDDLGVVPYTETNIRIHLKGRIPYKNPYACSPDKRVVFQKVINDMMNSGIIQESKNSPGGAPALLVAKKDGTHRLVVDYRELNKVVIKTPGPMPRIEDSMATLSGKKYFTILDLNQGYYQLEIPPEERHKTAFNTPDGKYEFCRLPMGYTDAPYEFQMLINKMLDGIMYKNALGYFDDLISFGSDWNEFMSNTRLLFDRIRKYGLKAKTTKCQAGVTSTVFLGHVVDGEGIRPNPKKVAAIKALQYPTSLKQLKSNLGLFTFLSRYIPKYSTVIEPLLRLTKKNTKFYFGEEQKTAFEAIREAIIEDCLLVHYNPQAQLKLSTDASDTAIGGILLQEDLENIDGDREMNKKYKKYWRPISYFSQTLMKYQQNYTVSEKELLAILVGINKFHHYLCDKEFVIETDHHALCQLPRLTFKNFRLNRWTLLLQSYKFTVVHVKGEKHPPDCLTRNCEWTHRKPLLIEEEAEEAIFKLIEMNPELDELELIEWANQYHKNDELSCDNKICAIQVPTEIEYQVGKQQERDETLGKLKQLLTDPRNHPRKDILRRFKLIRGVIYRKRDNYHSNDRIVITNEMFERIYDEYHNKKEGGHFGVTKTYNTISERYWCEKLKELIAKKIENCQHCIFYKAIQSTFSEPQTKGIPDHPLIKLEIDVAGPLKRSSSRNEYIIVAVDTLSRYVFATPTPDQTAKTVIEFLENIIYQFGIPKFIQSDQGTNFTSSEFADFCKEYGITHQLSSPYHPQSNGLVERLNRTIGEKVKMFCDGKPTTQWDNELHKIIFGINTTVHSVTKYTPFYLLHGFHPRKRLDNINQVQLPECDPKQDRIIAKQRLEENQQLMLEKAKNNPASYSVGDLVLIHSKSPDVARGKKLKGTYSGPYVILNYEKGHVSVVPLLEEGTISQYNVSQTKPYTSDLSEEDEERIKNICKKYDIPLTCSTHDCEIVEESSEIPNREKELSSNVNITNTNDDEEVNDPKVNLCQSNSNDEIVQTTSSTHSEKLANYLTDVSSDEENSKAISADNHNNNLATYLAANVSVDDQSTKLSIANSGSIAKTVKINKVKLILDNNLTYLPLKNSVSTPKLITEDASLFRTTNNSSFVRQAPLLTKVQFKQVFASNNLKFDFPLFEIINYFSGFKSTKSSHLINFIADQLIDQASDYNSVLQYLNTLTTVLRNKMAERNSHFNKQFNRDFHKDRNDFRKIISERFAINYLCEDVLSKFEFGQPGKGFTRKQAIHPYIGQFISKIQCYLCSHIAANPIKCIQCNTIYCKACAKWLHDIPTWMGVVECKGKEFICLLPECIQKKSFTTFTEIEKDLLDRFKQIKYQCRHKECSMTFDYDNILKHESACNSGQFDWNPDITLLSTKGKIGPFLKRYMEDHRPHFSDFLQTNLTGMNDVIISPNYKTLRNGEKWPYVPARKELFSRSSNSSTQFKDSTCSQSFANKQGYLNNALDFPPQYEKTANKICKTQVSNSRRNSWSEEGFNWPQNSSTDWPTEPIASTSKDHGNNFMTNSNARENNHFKKPSQPRPKDYSFSSYGPKRPRYRRQETIDLKLMRHTNNSRINTTSISPIEHVDWPNNLPPASPASSCYSYQSEHDQSDAKPYVRVKIWENLLGEDKTAYEAKILAIPFYRKGPAVTPTEIAKLGKRKHVSDRINRRALENWNKRAISTDIPLKEEIKDRIAQNLLRVNDNELPIISIHIASASIAKTDFPFGKPSPVWIAITNHTNDIIYETFVKQPKRSIRQMCTEFHGLRYEDIAFGRSEDSVRFQILEYLFAAKIIVGYSVAQHLKEIGIMEEEIKLLQPNIRELNIYYSPYDNKPCNKYVTTFLRLSLDLNLQTPYTPVNDAKAAMKLYLYDRAQIERIAKENNGIGSHCMKGILPNRDILFLLETISGQDHFWPESFMKQLGTKFAFNIPILMSGKVINREANEDYDDYFAQRNLALSSSDFMARPSLDHKEGDVMRVSEDQPMNSLDVQESLEPSMNILNVQDSNTDSVDLITDQQIEIVIEQTEENVIDQPIENDQVEDINLPKGVEYLQEGTPEYNNQVEQFLEELNQN